MSERTLSSMFSAKKASSSSSTASSHIPMMKQGKAVSTIAQQPATSTTSTSAVRGHTSAAASASAASVNKSSILAYTVKTNPFATTTPVNVSETENQDNAAVNTIKLASSEETKPAPTVVQQAAPSVVFALPTIMRSHSTPTTTHAVVHHLSTKVEEMEVSQLSQSQSESLTSSQSSTSSTSSFLTSISSTSSQSDILSPRDDTIMMNDTTPPRFVSLTQSSQGSASSSSQLQIDQDSPPNDVSISSTSVTHELDVLSPLPSISLVASTYQTPPSSPPRSSLQTQQNATLVAASPVLYKTPPRMREATARGHSRAQTLCMSGSGLPPPSPATMRSPIQLLGSGNSAAHRRGVSLSSSPIDKRYMARLAPSGTSSPIRTPVHLRSPSQQLMPNTGAVGYSPLRRDHSMTLSPYASHTGPALQPRKLMMPLTHDGSENATTASPQRTPAKRKILASPSGSPGLRATASPVLHPSLHVHASPSKRKDADELPAFSLLQSSAASASSASLSSFSSPMLTSPTATIGSHEVTLSALQESSRPYEYSDRYIPSRIGSNLEHAYFVSQPDMRTAASLTPDEMEEESMQENIRRTDLQQTLDSTLASGASAYSPAYGLLLRSEILGSRDGTMPFATPSSQANSAAREQKNAALILHRPGGTSSVVGSPVAAMPSATPNAATPGTPAAAASSVSSSSTTPGAASPSVHYPPAYRFKSARQSPSMMHDPFHSSSLVTKDTHRLLSTIPQTQRVIAKGPYKVLDAPQLKDDFYLNLVDWSSQNTVAVALGSAVYLWSGSTLKTTKLFDLDESLDSVTSVGWSLRGNHLSVGTRSGTIQIWDIAKQSCIQTLHGHTSRVGAVAWNSTLIASGSRDKNVMMHDPRSGVQTSNAILAGHTQEVCGLKWSYDEQQLASGGNDNKLMIWSPQHSTKAQYKFAEHTAAVKAISWSPHQHGLLCSGGGTADRCIRFWSTVTGTSTAHIDTGSQVCSLLWSRNVNEIVSTHGYSLNQIVVWKYPSMQQVTMLTGHAMRVLYLAASPDGQTIMTGAGDETLRFWNVFPSAEAKGSTAASSITLPTASSHLLR